MNYFSSELRKYASISCYFCLIFENESVEEKEKEYSGFWKNAGCILSVVAILGILAVFAIGLYMLIKGF